MSCLVTVTAHTSFYSVTYVPLLHSVTFRGIITVYMIIMYRVCLCRCVGHSYNQYDHFQHRLIIYSHNLWDHISVLSHTVKRYTVMFYIITFYTHIYAFHRITFTSARSLVILYRHSSTEFPVIVLHAVKMCTTV